MNLKQYLANSTDYETGVRLYNAHYGPGKWEREFPHIKSQRALAANLRYKLDRLLRKGVNISLPGPAPVITPTYVSAAAHNMPAQEPVVHAYPPGEEGERLKAADLYRKAGKRREDLFSDDIQIRAAAARDISQLMKQNRAVWDRINHFQQYGSWPEENDKTLVGSVSDKSVAELIAMSRNLPPWITKEKKKIESEQDPAKKKKREQMLADQQALLKQVKEALNG